MPKRILSFNVLFILQQVCSTMLVCGVMRNFFPHHIDNDENSLSPCVTSQNCLTTPLLLSDQHQISPCNINAYSTPEVMRINDMITQGEFS